MAGPVAVFRDMYLRGPLTHRANLRQALIDAAKAPWHYEPERANKLGLASSSDDILPFRREASDDYPTSGLTLWSTEDGYYVPNIVPMEVHELSIAQYNAILADFIERIARPVASRFHYEVDATKEYQDLEDWTSVDAAQKLRLFSSMANKSTGSSHPLDGRRFNDFIIAVHKSPDAIGTDYLMRWLCVVDGWDEDHAHKLVIEYENGLGLLKRYDEC